MKLGRSRLPKMKNRFCILLSVITFNVRIFSLVAKKKRSTAPLATHQNVDTDGKGST